MSASTIRIILAAEATGETGATTATEAGTEAHAEGHSDHNSFYGDKNELYWGSAAFLILVALFVWKGVPAVKLVAVNADAVPPGSDHEISLNSGAVPAETIAWIA
jgi:hypothetical protein